MTSCQDNGQVEIEKKKTETTAATPTDIIEYERKLEDLARYMGEVFKDPDARKELFGFAELKGNAGEVQYNLRRLFEEKTDPVSRKQSAIVQAFNRNASNSRVASEASINIDSLKSFINQHDISIIAPYLAETFDPDSIKELTVSWWTEEMEIEGLKKDPNWKGETPAIKFKIEEKEKEATIGNNQEQIGINNQIEYIIINDNYAYENPTIIFGQFDEPNYYRDTLHSPDYSSTYRDIDCRKIPEDKTVKLKMPKLRLHHNTRNWPNSNRLFIFAITGDYSIDRNGITNLHQNIDFPWGNEKGFKVSRFSVRKGKWVNSGISYLKQNWKRSQPDLRIMVAARKDGTGDIDYTGNISIDTNGDFHTDTSAKFSLKTKKHAYMLFNVIFDRCAVMAENGSDGVYGLMDGHHIYHFNGFSFYLAPEISE
ncbi:hypothetical protein GCM10011339_00740 [Echinicola rosea]|uniref:Uncharacterized protein n=2 Tax=Echinicola rosea TaxID=1807691 RepID=A0ABQ1UH62_9BACT|nr:hypothetical protein GCM10011339_00740 [Echinicola rosea]